MSLWVNVCNACECCASSQRFESWWPWELRLLNSSLLLDLTFSFKADSTTKVMSGRPSLVMQHRLDTIHVSVRCASSRRCEPWWPWELFAPVKVLHNNNNNNKIIDVLCPVNREGSYQGEEKRIPYHKEKWVARGSEDCCPDWDCNPSVCLFVCLIA